MIENDRWRLRGAALGTSLSIRELELTVAGGTTTSCRRQPVGLVRTSVDHCTRASEGATKTPANNGRRLPATEVERHVNAGDSETRQHPSANESSPVSAAAMAEPISARAHASIRSPPHRPAICE